MRSSFFFPALLLLLACGTRDCATQEQQQKIHEDEAKARWEGPCADEAVLAATTSGSPNGFTCWNKRHRMRVQVATKSTNEEAAALIFCECERGEVTEAGTVSVTPEEKKE